MKIAGTVLLLLLALYGLIRLLLGLCVRCLGGRHQGIWLLPLHGHMEDVELHLRFAWLVNLCGARPEVLPVDAGLDPESGTLARQAERCCHVRLLSVGEAEKLLQSSLHPDQSLL